MKLAGKHADEIRDTWQSKVLREAEGKFQRVLLAVIRAEYPAELLLLLHASFGTIDVPNPFYRGYATITPSGSLVCEVVDRDAKGLVWKGNVKVYDKEQELLWNARRLADKLKLSDGDRIDLFRVLKKWVTKDERLDICSEKTNAA